MIKTIIAAALFLTILIGSVQAKSPDERPNIVRIMPLAIFEDRNIGMGVSYERLIGKSHKLGINIPFYYGYKVLSYGTEDYMPYGDFLMFNPGVKFYLVNKTKVTFAIGPSIFASFGKGEHNVAGNFTISSYPITSREVGFLANGYIRFNITPRFNLGFELGLGPTFLTQYTNEQQQKTTESSHVYGVGSFHFGYRF